MNGFTKKTFGYISTTLVLGIFVISAALIAGFVLRQPNSSQAQSSTKFILPPAVYNRDIQAVVTDPIGSSIRDGIIPGSLCFDVNPPTFGGKFRTVLVMDLKDEPNAIIGASTPRALINPATSKCGNSTQSGGRYNDVFNLSFNLPDKDQWAEACPELRILVQTQGNWKQKPQEEIARISRDFVCPGGVPSVSPSVSPATSPSVSPSISPSVSPSVSPVPAVSLAPQQVSADLSGVISVYSCTQPKNVTIDVCDNANQTGCQTLKLQGAEANESVWLKTDEGDDRTHIYGYKVTKNSQGLPLSPNARMSVSSAVASIQTTKGTDSSFIAAKDDKNIVTIPATHDKTIDAQYSTCGCPFKAKAYIKDAATDQIMQTSSPAMGTANDMHIIKHGNIIDQNFTNGSLTVAADLFDFAKIFSPQSTFPFSDYGIDGLAMVRLYAPGYNVVKQECTSNGQVPGCPGYSYSMSKNTSSKDIEKLRVACGVDIEYGWVVERDPTVQLSLAQLFTAEQADVDNNGVVNILDLSTCEDAWGQTGNACDLDSNGLTNSTDVAGVIAFIGEQVNR